MEYKPPKIDINISTYTVIVNLSELDKNYNIDLHLISRFQPVYNQKISIVNQ